MTNFNLTNLAANPKADLLELAAELELEAHDGISKKELINSIDIVLHQASLISLTEKELTLFFALFNDRDNWSGSPLYNGDKSSNGVLTSLKKKGLLSTEKDPDNGVNGSSYIPVWVHFSTLGLAYGFRAGARPTNDLVEKKGVAIPSGGLAVCDFGIPEGLVDAARLDAVEATPVIETAPRSTADANDDAVTAKVNEVVGAFIAEFGEKSKRTERSVAAAEAVAGDAGTKWALAVDETFTREQVRVAARVLGLPSSGTKGPVLSRIAAYAATLAGE